MPKNNARPLPPRRRPLQNLSNNVAGPSVAQENPEEKSGNASEQDVDQVVDPNQIIEEIIDLCDTATGQGVDPDEDEDEEKEDKIDWVTRLRISNQKPPKDLGHSMPNGDIPINENNVKRFNEKCVSIITNLKSFADQQTAHSNVNWSDRAMTKVVIRVFQRLELADLTHAFLDSVPDAVKTILGAPELLPTDLLYLPFVDSSFRLWGVYVDIAMKADTDEVIGVYVGSSVAYKSYIGINGRVRHHERQAQREYNQLPENKRSRHYQAICRDDVEPNFRVLSLFEVTPGNSVATTIAEQVMVLFLGTMPSANPVQEQFACDIRALTPGLPNFGNLGLNRALPLAQSQRWMPTSQKLYVEWLKETNQLNQCFNCGRPGNETCDDKGWVGWYETRRCQPCYNRRWKYGEEKPRDLITDEQMHDIWVAQGNPDAQVHSDFMALTPAVKAA
ncbi:hypothetical protein H9Q74_000581 [Fusarium xylarioides]|nr:hypothetical protein H9Q71_004615 [Fusarium xylarioides]KAG5829373.1 hypothetical protein H9Q74_000581 [Fusarium xylarioides]